MGHRQAGTPRGLDMFGYGRRRRICMTGQVRASVSCILQL
uniref:Uncharacterized protein n=1 Tax=Triticum urartu TaxID=4572 RepID=A0A8R7UPJ9_TRIUA